MKNVKIGDVVVFNALPSATRFVVVESLENPFLFRVREENTDYAAQTVDVSQIRKVVAKA